MAINVNEKGTLKALSFQTNGFTLNGIDYIGDFDILAGTAQYADNRGLSPIQFPKMISNYKLLIFIQKTVYPGSSYYAQYAAAHNASVPGTACLNPIFSIKPSLLLAGMQKTYSAGSGTNKKYSYKTVLQDDFTPFFYATALNDGDTDLIYVGIYTSYNVKDYASWGVYAIY